MEHPAAPRPETANYYYGPPHPLTQQTDSALSSRMTAVETRVDEISSVLHRFVDSFDSFKNRVQDNSKTPWSILASWASVILGIGSVLFVLATDPLNREIVRLQEVDARQWPILRKAQNFDKIYDQKLNNLVLKSQLDNKIQDEKVSSLRRMILEIKQEQLRRTNRVYSKPRTP